jgi:hypothetical protein
MRPSAPQDARRIVDCLHHVTRWNQYPEVAAIRSVHRVAR